MLPSEIISYVCKFILKDNMEQTMGGLIFRGVGLIRAKANIALTNLVYNMCRLVQIKKYKPTLMTAQ